MTQAIPQQVAVVGVGRMGRHHARTYAHMPQAHLVAVVDADFERAAVVADEYGATPYDAIETMLAAHPDLAAATVAVPTQFHLNAARPLLERGVACLVEKPLASNVDDARTLAELAASVGVALQVGHTERFNPAVRAVASMGVAPRFIEVDRVSPMSFRSLDVGVVMDMMIHDLDIVLMLADSPIDRVDATGVAVLGDHEDIANARIVFESGCVANISASRLALKTERKLRLFSESAYVSLDYQKRTGIVIRKSDNERALEEVRRQIRDRADLSEVDYSSLVHVEELTMDLHAAPEERSDEGAGNVSTAPHAAPEERSDEGAGKASADPLTAELTSFLDAVREGRTPDVDAQAGYAAVDAAQRVVSAIAEHHWEGLVAPKLV